MHMYAHGHAHAHAHGGSGEMPGTGALVGSMGVTLVLVAIELTGGIFSGSIALISDAIHNLSDVPSAGDILAGPALGFAPRGYEAHLRVQARRNSGGVY